LCKPSRLKQEGAAANRLKRLFTKNEKPELAEPKPHELRQATQGSKRAYKERRRHLEPEAKR